MSNDINIGKLAEALNNKIDLDYNNAPKLNNTLNAKANIDLDNLSPNGRSYC